MRKTLAALMLAIALPAAAQLTVTIGINVPSFPTLQRIPDYPVYYAPNLRGNYFFYDGLYWVYDRGEWYSSAWYNGPWEVVDRYEVPDYVLRVPVRYYREAPPTFRSWRADAPPRWEVVWGPSWESRRSGWDRWERRSAPAIAPLPVYQRQYSRDRYPRFEEQYVITTRSYRYEPRDERAREVYKKHKDKADKRRGPPDHAVAKGLRNRDEDGRGPPSHAVARGHDRDDDRGRGRDKDKDKDKDRGRDDHPGKGKGHDRDDHPGKGKGRDKD